jgi:hypothetical protein
MLPYSQRALAAGMIEGKWKPWKEQHRETRRDLFYHKHK